MIKSDIVSQASATSTIILLTRFGLCSGERDGCGLTGLAIFISLSWRLLFLVTVSLSQTVSRLTEPTDAV